MYGAAGVLSPSGGLNRGLISSIGHKDSDYGLYYLLILYYYEGGECLKSILFSTYH